MSSFLLVTDEAGNPVCKSRSVSMPAAFHIALQSENAPCGILRFGGHTVYAKPVRLCGKVYRFYMDFDGLQSLYGVSAAERAAEGLFDLSAIGGQKVTAPLSSLMAHFYAHCTPEARRHLQKMHAPEEVAVSLSPNGFALTLTLLLKLLCGSAAFSFAVECGRVTVFADGTPDTSAESLFGELLLREVCGACGFALTKTERGGICRYALELTPLDPALLGLKAESLFGYGKNVTAYTEWFL